MFYNSLYDNKIPRLSTNKHQKHLTMKTLSKEEALKKLSQHFNPIDYAYKNAFSGDKTARGLNVTVEVDELLLEFTADCEYNPKEPFVEFINAKDTILWLDDDTNVIVLGSEIENMFSNV